MNAKKLVVCDVCDTLYRSNTTFDFIRFVSKRGGPLGFFLFSVLADRKSPVFYFLILAGKIMRKDIVRSSVLRMLGGKSNEELMLLAHLFYHEFLIARANEKAFQLLPENSVDMVVLISSSIDPVVRVIAQECKFSFVSSQLEWKEGIATGYLETDLTGRKHEVAKRLMHESSLDRLQVITDNRSDWKLVSLADERFVIIRSEGERKFWNELNPVFIRV